MKYIKLFEKFQESDWKFYIKTKDFDGFKLMWGINHKSSDHLTQEISNDDDLWINLDDLSLNHYVLRVGKYKPDQNLLKQVGRFILKNEKIKDQDSLLYCKRRFVKKSEISKPGEVTVDKINSYRLLV